MSDNNKEFNVSVVDGDLNLSSEDMQNILTGLAEGDVDLNMLVEGQEQESEEYLEESEILIGLDLNNVEIDKEQFQQGVNDVSRVAGMYLTLKSIGMDNKDIMDFILSKHTIEFNLESAKITTQGNLDIARIQKMAVEKLTP